MHLQFKILVAFFDALNDYFLNNFIVNTVALDGEDNKISKIENGVVSINTGFSLKGSEIKDLTEGGVFSKFGVYAFTPVGPQKTMTIDNCSFSNLRTAVYAETMNSTVRNCSTAMVENGFHGLTKGQATIKNNNISATKHGIFADAINMLTVDDNERIEVNGDAESFGIRIEAPNNTSVTINRNEYISGIGAENTIRMSGGGSIRAAQNAVFNLGNDNGFGINIRGVRSMELYCNGVDGVGTGIFDSDTKGTIECNQTRGSNTGMSFSGMPGNVLFKGNTMAGHGSEGLFISGGGTSIGQQLHHGNVFFSDAQHDGTNVPSSRFTIHTNMVPTRPTDVITPASNPILWFDVDDEGEPFECADAACGSGFDFPEPPDVECEEFTVLDISIADGSLNTGDMREGNWWNAQRQLLDKIRIPCPETPPVMPPDVVAFANNHQNSVLGALLDVEIGLRDLESMEGSEYQAVVDLQNLLELEVDSWVNLATQLEDENLTASEIEHLQQQQATSMQNIEQFQTQQTGAWSNYQTFRANLTNQLLGQNAGVTPISIAAQNEQTVNAIYLQTFAQDVEMNAEQLTTLYSVAIQCPQDGGISVHKARAMYAHIHPEEMFSDEGCDIQSEFRISHPTNTKPTTVKTSILPNPTDGLVNINLAITETRNIKVLNGLGQVVHDLDKAKDQFQLSIDLSAYKSGFYFIQIWNNDALESVEKISLIK